jgi:hypothetical protein
MFLTHRTKSINQSTNLHDIIEETDQLALEDESLIANFFLFFHGRLSSVFIEYSMFNSKI